MEPIFHNIALHPEEVDGTNNVTAFGYDPTTRHSTVYEPLIGSFFCIAHPDPSLKTESELNLYSGSRVIEIPLYNAFGDELGLTSDNFYINPNLTGGQFNSTMWSYSCMEVKLSISGIKTNGISYNEKNPIIHMANTLHFPFINESGGNYVPLTSFNDNANSPGQFKIVYNSSYGQASYSLLTDNNNYGVDADGNLNNCFRIFGSVNTSTSDFPTLYLKYFTYNNNQNDTTPIQIQGLMTLF